MTLTYHWKQPAKRENSVSDGADNVKYGGDAQEDDDTKDVEEDEDEGENEVDDEEDEDDDEEGAVVCYPYG